LSQSDEKKCDIEDICSRRSPKDSKNEQSNFEEVRKRLAVVASKNTIQPTVSNVNILLTINLKDPRLKKKGSIINNLNIANNQRVDVPTISPNWENIQDISQ